jgi:hypothetical protein
MAYPTAPGRRIGYDEDGTIVYFAGLVSGTTYVAAGSAFPDAAFSLISTADMQEANNTDASTRISAMDQTATATDANQISVWIFPELRDIDGYYIARVDEGGVMVSYSTDTTNGRDGSWTAFGTLTTYRWNSTTAGNMFTEAWRSKIVTSSASAVRAVRYASNCSATSCVTGVRLAHWYGEIASGESPDRLLIVDNADDLEFTSPIDTADTPRGMAEDVATIYLTNNSGTLQANTTTVDPEDLESLSDGWYTVNVGGGAFGSSISITTILAGADSADIIVRRDTANDAEPGLYGARLEVKTASWS